MFKKKATKKLTGDGYVAQVTKLLEKTCHFDNLVIIERGIWTEFGESKMDAEYNSLNATVDKVELNHYRPELDVYKMVIMYDGGFMYSIMDGEFGYEARDTFMEELQKILEPYGLDCDLYDSTTLIING